CWFTLAKAEESYLYQRSRVNWIDVGDSNSTYYHRSLRSRQAVNQLSFSQTTTGPSSTLLKELKLMLCSSIRTCLEGQSLPLMSLTVLLPCAKLQLKRSSTGFGTSVTTVSTMEYRHPRKYPSKKLIG
ncbi:hypothetical protein HID58_092939, partial [Brassica napus]